MGFEGEKRKEKYRFQVMMVAIFCYQIGSQIDGLM
jgi:hypothetical protein